MRYLSVCSGIEAATCAWHHMGWKPEAFSEIEPFPSAVLAHHYPDTPNLGDMTKYKEWNLGAIDLLVGGTPCQSFSVAGLRKGLADPRGNLALVYLGIADLFKPKWIVWENVPGVLSSNGGRDFGSFLGALAQLGYGFAYRVLDAQWFGVAQRRKRVFVVGYLGDWRPAAAVLFESESLSGNPKPSREKGERVAPTVVQGPPFSRTGNQRVECEAIVSVAYGFEPGIAKREGNPSRFGEEISPTLRAAMGDNQAAVAVGVDTYNGTVQGNIAATLTADMAGPTHSGPKVMQPVGFDAYNNAVTGDVSKTLDTGQDYHHVPNVMQPVGAFKSGQGAQSRSIGWDENVSPTLPSNAGGNTTPVLLSGMAVRRLTPRECERLQGFRDDYTLIPWRGKEAPDGPRYKALGNSMAVPVMRWIGERIESLRLLQR